MPSTLMSHSNNSRTDLAAAGKMCLEAGHTGVDGFTALQAGDSCGESPPTTLHMGHPTSTSEHSGASLRGRSLKSWILGRVGNMGPQVEVPFVDMVFMWRPYRTPGSKIGWSY